MAIAKYILVLMALIAVGVGVFFTLAYIDNKWRPNEQVEKVETLGIETLILELKDIDSQIISLENQQESLNNQINLLKAKRAETVNKLNDLLERIREYSNINFVQPATEEDLRGLPIIP